MVRLLLNTAAFLCFMGVFYIFGVTSWQWLILKPRTFWMVG